MNDVVITGATGVVGRRAVRELLATGHRITGVTRSARGARLLEGLGARAVEADVFDAASLAAAFAGANAVVNLLTHIPPADRMASPGAWEENDRLRREASAVIARAAQDAGAERLVQESLAFVSSRTRAGESRRARAGTTRTGRPCGSTTPPRRSPPP